MNDSALYRGAMTGAMTDTVTRGMPSFAKGSHDCPGYASQSPALFHRP
ncbi:MAG: hypothetical protein ACLQKK_18680 [Rhodomicrobium sp.]